MRITSLIRTADELFWRFVPLSALIVVSSYVLGAEIADPHRRLVKVFVLMLVMVIMYRFEMIYSLYLFILLFPFPTGIALSSSNVILMTLIPLLWLVRAQSMQQKVWEKTGFDKWLLLFFGLHLVSFFNIDNPLYLRESLKLVWRLATAIAFMYMIVRFADSVKKLDGLARVFAISAALVGSTGIIEAFFPGATIIPGWITTTRELGTGGLGQERIRGLRIGGALGSHSLLSDYSTLALFFMGLFFMRARNPITKTMWGLLCLSAFATVLSTANRGAFVALVVGLTYVLWVFRSRLSIGRLVVVASIFIAAVWIGDTLLSRYTAAVSILDRFTHTEFTGVVPETRTMTWKPALVEAMNHIFIGHGPYFDPRSGIEKLWWPHNAYIFYLYSIGVTGLATFLVIVYKLFRMSLAYARPLARGEYLGMLAGIIHVQLVMFLIAQLRTDHQRNGDFVYMYIVFFLFGMIVASYRLIRKRERGFDPGGPGGGTLSPTATDD